MYFSTSNPYINGGPPLQFQQTRESAYLSKVGENIIYNQDYATQINRTAKNKQEYGEMLRQQMKEKQEYKALQNEQQQIRNYNRPGNFPQQLSQMEQNRNQQMSSDIFNQGSIGSYPNNQLQQLPYTQQNIQNQFYQQAQFNNQDYMQKREEYLKKSEVYWSQPKNYRGSLLKEYYNDTYFEEKERKQKAFAQSLADQINEKRLQQKQQDKPKQIQYLPESDVLEKNKSNILDSIMKIQQKSNENDQQSFKIQLDPTNAYNKNHILYHELNKSENAYRWRPGGEWQRGKADFDVLKGLYRKQEEVFEKQKEDLKIQADNAQRNRDQQYVEMVIMRDKIQHNDKVRALNVRNEYLDSTVPRGKEENANPQNYFQNKQGLVRELQVPRDKYDNIYFKHNYELPSQSVLLNPNYIQNKFDKQERKKNLKDGELQNQESRFLGQYDEDDPYLEQMLDNFYKDEVGGEEFGDEKQIGKKKRRNSTDARINVSKIRQKSNPNLNQSQNTEYNLLHQLEEEEQSNQQKSKNQDSKTNLQGDHKNEGNDQNNRLKSGKQNQQDNDFNEDNLSQSGAINNNNNNPDDVDNLDISKIESQRNVGSKNLNKNQNQISNKNMERDQQNQMDNFEEENDDQDKIIQQKQRPLSAFNKRNEVKLQNLQNQSEIFPYRIVKEKSIYEQQKAQEQSKQINFKKLYSMQEKDNIADIQDGKQLDKSIEQDQDIDRIIDEIGGMMRDIHVNEEITIPSEDLREKMQFDKYQQISKLHTVNSYNHGLDNPYLNDFYRKSHKPNHVVIENTPENKQFIQSSNQIDYLIGQLVQDRKIY